MSDAALKEAGAGLEAKSLPDALRAAALRASSLAAGAPVLLFAHTETPQEGAPPLRAAAGFASAEAARERALAVSPALAAAPAGPPGAGAGGWLAPLGFGGRVHGALWLAADPGDATGALAELAHQVGLRLDHAALSAGLEPDETAGADPDKLLELSEALFAQDIELIRKDERLGKIERLKSDFIEKMSRELRTPLNSIIEAIISVLAGENENLSESARAAMRRALDEGSAFLRTLQNILDLWKIKQNELPVELQEVSFREVVDEAIFSVQDALGSKPILIEKRLSEPFPKLRTDLAKVNQLLFQTLENAVKFTEQGKVEIEAHVANGVLSCSVRDTGIGICHDDRQLVFEEFFQVDEGADSAYRGSGLGLALVRDLVKLLDGEIEVESEVGEGSTFRFRVPVEVLG